MKKRNLVRWILSVCVLVWGAVSFHTIHELREEMQAIRRSVEAFESTASFGEALRNGEIKSILVIGDSISDGNGDSYYLYHQEDRAEQGCRLILTENGNSYYESDLRGQGWVTHFRNYLLECTEVKVIHNNAIGEKSAKWGNENKELWIPEKYDAIIVMLGTNDRWDCAGAEEFYAEYSQFLAYAESMYTYLQVFTPIPAISQYGDMSKNMDSREIADTVLDLCADNGYACINLYAGLQEYAAERGRTLDEMLQGGTHPSPFGYLSIWRLIAEELGLNLPIETLYDADVSAPSIYTLVCEREEITEETRLSDTLNGETIFPLGISVYHTRASDPLIEGVTYGGTLVTYKNENGTGKQIFKPHYYDYDFIRYADADSNWGGWSKTNRDQFSRED